MKIKGIRKTVIITLLLLAAYAVHNPGHTVSGTPALPSLMNSTQRLPLNLYALNIPAASTNLGPYVGNMTVMLGMQLRNTTALNSFLRNLSNPSSPEYGHYLSHESFIKSYSPSSQLYVDALSYFQNFNGLSVKGYSDRLAISITGNAASIGSAFHTEIYNYISGSNHYFSALSPGLPSWLENHVVYVNGLDNYSKPSMNLGGSAVNAAFPGSMSYSNGYPLPAEYGVNSQLVWGSDMQKAYNVSGIINATSLNGTAIATIFWTDGVAPFYPEDVQKYFNETLPSWEMKPKVVAVPIDGASLPGLSAQNDTGGAAFENTLDIEMAGSMAPGATIYNVYAPDNSFSELDQAFAHILNPDNASSGLNNVSVISNSWYSTDTTDPVWSQYLEEATARGITVLACSGDSADNSTSPKYLGTNAAFPGTVANTTSGVLSVGGTSIMLNTSTGNNTFLTLSSQAAWFNQAYTENNNGPIGSQGGISTLYPEPPWQINSTANRLLNGTGRGVPDVSAVANYMMMFITISGRSYYNNPYYYYAWGTSIATPVTAGLIADINAYLVANNYSRVGFINPLLYNLSNIQYSYGGLSQSAYPHYRDAFNDVINGSNSLYSAGKGYDLVTGLGSINAGNLAHDIMLNITFSYGHNNSRITTNTTNSTGISPLSPLAYRIIGGGILTAVILAAVGFGLRYHYRKKNKL